MTTNRKFSDKGQAILGDRHHFAGIADVLAGQERSAPTPPAESPTEPATKPAFRASGTPDPRPPGLPERQQTVKPVAGGTEPALPPKREEVKLPGPLAERLRLYAFQTRAKKTAVVIAALEAYLQQRGY